MLRSSSRRGWRAVRSGPSTGFVTPGLRTALERSGGKRGVTTHYAMHPVEKRDSHGTLFVERPSRAARFAATSGAGLLALALAVIAGVMLLRRWVVSAARPPGGRRRAHRRRRAGRRARQLAGTREVARGRRGAAGDGRRAARRTRRAARGRERNAASCSPRSPMTCGRRCSRCAGRSRRSSTASATPITCAARGTRRRCWTGSSATLFTFSRLEYAGPAAGRATYSTPWRSRTRRPRPSTRGSASSRGRPRSRWTAITRRSCVCSSTCSTTPSATARGGRAARPRGGRRRAFEVHDDGHGHRARRSSAAVRAALPRRSHAQQRDRRGRPRAGDRAAADPAHAAASRPRTVPRVARGSSCGSATDRWRRRAGALAGRRLGGGRVLTSGADRREACR